MKPKFQIGDEVWVAGYDQSEKQVECPDCMGKKIVKLTLSDGTEYSLDCGGCSRAGWDPPRGFVTAYHRIATGWPGTVREVGTSHQDENKFRYSTHDRSADEDDVFLTRDEAVARAADVIRRSEEEDAQQLIHRKRDVRRTWAWHVHYYRRQIRDAEKTIKYATAQLNVAKEKVKE